MEWNKRVLLLLLLLYCDFLAVVNQSEASVPPKSTSFLKKWFDNLFSGWIQRSPSFNHKSTSSAPLIESSFTSEKELLLSSRQNGGCSCFNTVCSTTCTSLSIQCFRTCTITTEFKLLTSVSYLTSYSTGCDQVTAGCTATAVAVAAGAAAVAIAVGVAVPLSTPTTTTPSALPEIFFFNSTTTTPANLNPIPAGGNLPDDGCGISSGRFLGGHSIQQVNGRRIKTDENWTLKDKYMKNQSNCTRKIQKDENAFKKELENDHYWIRTHGTWNFTDNRNKCNQIKLDGECHQLLSRGPCRNQRFWFTLDPRTLKGQCTPRLCGRGRVFVGETGLCHDSEDPSICKGGRQLFYTAYGDPICDCPLGEYPFPGEQSDCVTIFTRGSCPLGQVVGFSQTGTLQCAPSQCSFKRNEDVPLVPFEDGRCYPLGSQGPCRRQPFQLLGYDVFERRAVCVNVTAIGSPYFELDEDIETLDENYNQLLPEYDDFRISFFANKPAGKRQGESHTTGLFQLIANFPKDPLLNPCQSGARTGNNYKCINPILFLGKKQRLLQVVRSAFECPGASILQATGKCGNDARSASCGPSYQYVESIGECRAVFRI